MKRVRTFFYQFKTFLKSEFRPLFLWANIKLSVSAALGSDYEDDDDDKDDDDDSWIISLVCGALKPMYVMEGKDLDNQCAAIPKEEQVG